MEMYERESKRPSYVLLWRELLSVVVLISSLGSIKKKSVYKGKKQR